MAVGMLPSAQCSLAECCRYGNTRDYEVCLHDTNTPSLRSLCSPCMCDGVCQQLNFANVKKGSRYIDCVSLEGTRVRPSGGGSCLKNSSREGGGQPVLPTYESSFQDQSFSVSAELFQLAIGIVERVGVSTMMTAKNAVFWVVTL